MGIYLVRFEKMGEMFWGVKEDDQIIPVSNVNMLQELMRHYLNDLREITEKQKDNSFSINEVKLVAPVTPNAIICQGVNYSSHREETGVDVQKPPFNLIFSKAASSISGPYDPIVKPERVKLLDYEIELAIVLKKEIHPCSRIEEDNLHEYILGVTIANDVSARDIQFLEHQWLKGKSFRTFCPVGPYVYVPEPDEIHEIFQLELELSVNGEIRQKANTSQLLYKPVETLNELAQVMDLSPGDLLLTGTPGGVAMQFSQDEMSLLSSLSTGYDEKKNIIDRHDSCKYLKEGDMVEATIYGAGGIHLGTQRNEVVLERRLSN